MVLTVILVTQFQVATESFHSMTPEVKQISSVMVVMQHAIWAQALQIITKAVEVEAVALDIKMHPLHCNREVWEWVAMVATVNRMVEKVLMGFAVYSIIIFQVLHLIVMQKKFSLNADKYFENIQVYDVAYCILQLVMQLIYSMIAKLMAAVLCGYIIN